MSNKNFSDAAFQIIRSHIESWRPLSFAEVKAENLGGLSNINHKVTVVDKKIQPASVIFRCFHSITVDRDKDNYIFHELYKAGIGRKCYAATKEYRIEEFIDAILLGNEDVNKKPIRRVLAKLISSIHKLYLEKLDKTALMYKILYYKKCPFKEFEEFLESGQFSTEDRLKIEEIKKLISEEEVLYLLNQLPSDPKDVVFSHNDFHHRNLLQDKSNKKIVAIDFEYGDYNYRTYDIANLFNEMMIDYSKLDPRGFSIEEECYPTPMEMIDFLNYYVLFNQFDNLDFDENGLYDDDSILKIIVNNSYNILEFNQEVKRLYKQMLSCRLLSHFYWIMWSVVQSKVATKDFDYLNYAFERYKIYQRFKKENSQLQQADIDSLLLKI